MCTGKNCNFRQSFSRCLTCSTSENSQCAINPDNNSKICTKYEDDCFIVIGEFIVSRGCVGEKDEELQLYECENREKCEICKTKDENNCNNRAIVMERCIECDTSKEDDLSCSRNPIEHKDKICSKINSVEREGCYLRQVRVLFVNLCIIS